MAVIILLLASTVLSSVSTFLNGGLVLANNAPEAEWSRTFGGSDYDYAETAQQTSDGGYIITGYTNSYGAGLSDVWLIKTNSSGNKVWDKTFGGSNFDLGFSVQQTSDGGYIIVGDTQSYGAGDRDVWLIKTNASGNEEWNQTFGSSDGDRGYCVQQTSDGGYIIAGETKSYGNGDSDVWLIKTDSDGNEEWNQTFGGTDRDIALSVQQASDGGYIITGDTESYGAGLSDVWLIKTNSSGNKIWDKTFGGSKQDHGYTVQQASDGGYIVTGYTESYGAGLSDVWLIKTNSSGNKVWDKTFGGSTFDMGSSVQQTSEGGFIVSGYTESYGVGSWDVWLIKTDSSGNKVWDKTFGGSTYDYGSSVQQTSDGGFILTGSTSSYGFGLFDAWLVKVEPEPPIVPSIYSASPSSGNQDETLNVKITGANLTGASNVSFDTGITINSFTVDNNNQITANISIDSDATLGTRNVSVTTPEGADTLTSGFTITSPSSPAITEVNPSFRDQGETLDVTITGANLTGATAVGFGNGITLNSFSIDNATQITANITISSDATLGTRDVSVTTPGGYDTLNSGFTVGAPSSPWITEISPGSGNQGETLNVTITGASFIGATAMSLGDGITLNSFNIDNDTQITADITINSDATTGSRDVSITTPGGSGTFISGFTVTNPFSPRVTRISPDSGIQGETLNVTITGTNLTGATDISFGTGITVNSFTVDSSTQITANISIDAKAVTTDRNVSVTTPIGTDTLEDCFMMSEENSESYFELYFKLTNNWIFFIAASEAVIILTCLIYFIANKKSR